MKAFHYTTGHKFVLIKTSGMLLPTDIGVSFQERPILWFSLNQQWEQTANKALADSRGILRKLSMDETRELGGGLVRFGIEPRRLFFGTELQKKARMNNKTWRALVAEGLRQGAKPSEWGGALGPLNIAELETQQMADGFKWEPIP